MADIKIPSGPTGNHLIDAVKEAGDSANPVQETQPTTPTEQVAADPIDRIAEAVASGHISQTEAVNQILTEVMDAPMVKAVPESLRLELEEMLRHLLDEDPYLRSLQAAIAPHEIE